MRCAPSCRSRLAHGRHLLETGYPVSPELEKIFTDIA
jgi:hypothetical protein